MRDFRKERRGYSRPMPSSATMKKRDNARAKPRKKSTGKKSARSAGWKRLWPLAVCLLITPFAIRSASILALEGPKAFALLYPWVDVVRSAALHVPEDLLETLTQWIIYLQFLFDGLVMKLTFRADKHLRAF